MRPLGVSLMFASAAEIAAAPAEEREAYLRIVNGILTDPEAYGFRLESPTELVAVDDNVIQREDNTPGDIDEFTQHRGT